jgi:hyaluronoglucosaminidase
MPRTLRGRAWLAVVVAGLCAVPAAPTTAAASPTTGSPTTGSPTTGSAAAVAGRAPDVWPVPRSMRTSSPGFPVPSSVRLVTGSAADPAAVGLVRQVLTSAGARVVTGGGPRTTVYVGGGSAGDPAARTLAAMRVPGPSGLPSGGYVLATGTGHGGARNVVVSGADATGTYYAAQTLRQLLATRPARVPGVEIRDWPAMPLRGTIEGFYGPPWTAADRLSHLDFLARTKQNVYVYSPKDDEYLRAKWRDPYPAGLLAGLKRLVDRATADHVDFTYALSPGLSVCYSSAADEQALLAKFTALWNVGVRAFAVPLDDVPIDTFNCAADEQRFGSGEEAMGTAQSAFLNAVQRDFIAAHPGARRLEMVPTAYGSVADRPYKKALREHLSPEVISEWTGGAVVSPTVTAAAAREAVQVYGHDVLLWDNYPVNDYATDRLLLGPYVGREPGIADTLTGVTANPMIEAEPSKIAEFTSGAFTWNPRAYDPEAAWEAAIADLGGPAAPALRVLADNSRSSQLDPAESPTLTPLIAGFWSAWDGGGDPRAAAQALDGYFARMAAVPEGLRAHLPDRAFLDEARPWIDKLGAYGRAGRTAVRLLLAVRAGDAAEAARERDLLDRQRDALKEITQRMAPGVMDPFLDRVEKAARR